MVQHGVADWPDRPAHVNTYEQCKNWIDTCLRSYCCTAWAQEAAQHTAAFPYLSFQTEPSSMIAFRERTSAPWATHVQLASFIKVRAGLLVLSSRKGHFSRARLQECIFCNGTTDYAVLHVFGFCCKWNGHRKKFCDCAALAQNTVESAIVNSFLGRDASELAFVQALAWAHDVYLAELNLWRAR